MEDGIGPLLFRYQPEQFSYLNVKIAASDMAGTLEKLGVAWHRVDPVHTFQYQFFDDQMTKVNQWMGDCGIDGWFHGLTGYCDCLLRDARYGYLYSRKKNQRGGYSESARCRRV